MWKSDDNGSYVKRTCLFLLFILLLSANTFFEHKVGGFLTWKSFKLFLLSWTIPIVWHRKVSLYKFCRSFFAVSSRQVIMISMSILVHYSSILPICRISLFKQAYFAKSSLFSPFPMHNKKQRAPNPCLPELNYTSNYLIINT